TATASADAQGNAEVLVQLRRSQSCQAIAISNFSVYGCIDKHVNKSIEYNTTCEGTPVTLKAFGYSLNTTGYTWQVCDPSVSPAYSTLPQTTNEIVITPTLGLKKYRVTYGGETSESVDIQGIVCCNVEGDTYTTLWSDDFGTVTPGTRQDYANVVDHTFADVGTRLADGTFCVVSNSSDANWDTGMVGDKTDHTGNTNGGFLVINVGEPATSGVEFEQLILQKDVTGVNFCANVWYNFSMWASQLAQKGANPSAFILRIYELNGAVEGALLGETNTGYMDVFAMEKWVNYTISVSPGNVTGLRIKIYNLGKSGDGNDLAIDDLQFTSCSPQVKLYADYDNKSDSIEVKCGQSMDLISDFNGNVNRYFSSSPYYLWQKSTDQVAWTNVGTATQGKATLTINPSNETGEFYRVIIAATQATADKIASGTSTGECDIYTITNSAFVKCEKVNCDKPVVSLTNYSTNVCENGAFTPVVISGTAVPQGSDYIAGYKWYVYTESNPTPVLISENATNATTFSYSVNSKPTENTYYSVEAINSDYDLEVCNSKVEYSFLVNEEPELTLTPVNTTLGCGAADVVLTASVVGAGADISYNWSGGISSLSTATVSAAGTYSVTVLNTTTGCSSSASVSVVEDVPSVPVTISHTELLGCNTAIVLTA
ncbi:MAG: hypothetical protein IJ270_03130, partial [Paludibacteraceae bacterium]|nr:hypothetical protein [Paludibacteraceae bacterium]